MTTKREYLKTQGITVGARGRFSGAAKVAIEEALKKGITFTAEKPQPSKTAKQQIGGPGGATCQASPLLIQWRDN